MSDKYLAHIFSSFRIVNSSLLRSVFRALCCLRIAFNDSSSEWFPYFPFLVDAIHCCWTEYESLSVTRCLILDSPAALNTERSSFWNRRSQHPPPYTKTSVDCDYCAVKNDSSSWGMLLQSGLFEAVQYRVPRGDTVIATIWGTDQSSRIQTTLDIVSWMISWFQMCEITLTVSQVFGNEMSALGSGKPAEVFAKVMQIITNYPPIYTEESITPTTPYFLDAMSFVYHFAPSDGGCASGEVLIIEPPPCHRRRKVGIGSVQNLRVPQLANELSSLLTIQKAIYCQSQHIPYRNSTLGKILKTVINPAGLCKTNDSLDFVYLFHVSSNDEQNHENLTITRMMEHAAKNDR